MIASVRGTVAALGPDGAVIEVGGVGLSVSCSPGTLARLRVGEPARLATSLVVREDSLTLFGFADDDERALFELLQTANGVGPKLAQTMLAVHPPRELRRAIADERLRSPDAGAGHRPQGGRAHRPRAARPDRRDRRLRTRAVDLRGIAAVAPWRDQLTACAGRARLHRARRPPRRSRSSPRTSATSRADVALLLRRSIQLLGRTR